MLDKAIQHALRPLMTQAARGLVHLGAGADAISFVGFAIGVLAAAAIACQLVVHCAVAAIEPVIANSRERARLAGCIPSSLGLLVRSS